MKISIDRLKKERSTRLKYQDFQFQDKKLREHTLNPIDVDVNIILVGDENIRVVGSIEGEFELVCDRCNELFIKHKSINVDHILDIEKKEMIDRMIDLDAKVNDLVLMDFSIKLLCSDNCKGICLGCGVNLNKERCKCALIKK
ncbi:MAG: DUF177 domain-containing protein [Endomicrobia bacterium]|nr:DUF177 domain-containing protein [Endomicrobiia bacterium]